MTSLIKIQSFKVGKNDDNYVSKVLEAAVYGQYNIYKYHMQYHMQVQFYTSHSYFTQLCYSFLYT